MGRKIIIYLMPTARAIRQNVIGLPVVATDYSAANMAPAASLRQYHGTLTLV